MGLDTGAARPKETRAMKKILLAILLSACATVPITEQVKIRAANDLKCETSEVQTTQVDANTVLVNACGHQQTYVQQCVAKADPVPVEAGFSDYTTQCDWETRGSETNLSSRPSSVSQ
jgi:hypothetical protein